MVIEPFSSPTRAIKVFLFVSPQLRVTAIVLWGFQDFCKYSVHLGTKAVGPLVSVDERAQVCRKSAPSPLSLSLSQSLSVSKLPMGWCNRGLSVCASVSPYRYLSSLSISLSVCPSIHPSSYHLSIDLNIDLFIIYLSTIYPHICQ
jgi:hypothetical protein